jgi:hypothetical protein
MYLNFGKKIPVQNAHFGRPQATNDNEHGESTSVSGSALTDLISKTPFYLSSFPGFLAI